MKCCLIRTALCVITYHLVICWYVVYVCVSHVHTQVISTKTVISVNRPRMHRRVVQYK